MLRNILFFCRFFLFWLLFFLFDRLAFLLINAKKIAAIPFSEIAATFYHALSLDLSMIAYILAIPLFSYIFWMLAGRKTVTLKWLSTYNNILVVLFSIISVVNFNIYREWGSKVNAKALGFAISTPNEALASSVSSPIALSLSLLVLLSFTGFVLQRYVAGRELSFPKMPLWLRIAIIPLLLLGCFALIRGGLRGSPINQSMGYFSKDQLLNHAAVNTEWNLLSSIIAARKTNHNPYLYFSRDEAQQRVRELYAVKKDSTLHILKTDRPNVVLVVIESFTADLTRTLGGEQDITPHFDDMISKGVLFSNIYASGSRTDKGLVASLAGFPTLAAGSIVKWPEKMQKLPAIAQPLFRNGYRTSFYYGGESEFDNYKAFILSHDYQRLVDRNSFTTPARSPWGQFDEAVFSRQLADLNHEKQPFFSSLLTLTNHEPYVLPGKPRFGSADNRQKFKSTAYYTDSCIHAYLESAKKQSWYANTLFIFVADHGHPEPKGRYDIFKPERYHIPLLFYGDVIRDEYKGRNFTQTGSQADIAATLLGQLGIPATGFVWSKNLLNPYTRQFAFFSWDNGMGFTDNRQCITFDNVGKLVLYNSDPRDQVNGNALLEDAKAYLQVIYQEFIDL